MAPEPGAASSVIDGEGQPRFLVGPHKEMGFQATNKARITREENSRTSSATPATANSGLGQPWGAHRSACYASVRREQFLVWAV